MAARDEIRHGQLGDRVDVPLCATRGRHRGVHLLRGEHHPAQTQCRCQALARRTQVHHAIRIEALQRADGLTVVSELAVVVVFEDIGVGAPRPVHHRGTPGGVQRQPVGEVVGRGDQRGGGVEILQVADDGALPVEPDRGAGASGRLDAIPKDEEAVGLYRYRPGQAAHPRQYLHGVTGAGADQNRIRCGADTAHPGHVFGYSRT
ncbi:Uncharacterised protein [Mycobacteroides abscessus subsp. massiliense]|nr:Uncharacterised protein [Mycobacteroides abscessus subsp. massiliense]